MKTYNMILRVSHIWMLSFALCAGLVQPMALGDLIVNPPPDADKAFLAGNESCGLATAANLLAGAGYGTGLTMQDRADDIYGDMVVQYGTVFGQWPDTCLTWWINSAHNTDLTNPYRNIQVSGNKIQAPWLNPNAPRTIGNDLREWEFVGVVIYNTNSHHAITAWGDEAALGQLTNNPTQIWVTDSDTDAGGDVQHHTYDAYSPIAGWRFNGGYANPHVTIENATNLQSVDIVTDHTNTQVVVGSYKIHQNDSQKSATDLHYIVGTDVDILSYRTEIDWQRPNNPAPPTIVEDNPRRHLTVDWDMSEDPVPYCTWVTITTKFVVPTWNTVEYSNVHWTYPPGGGATFPGFRWGIETPTLVDPEEVIENITGGYVVGSFDVFTDPEGTNMVSQFRGQHEYDYFQDPEDHLFELASLEDGPYYVGNIRFGHSYGLLDDDSLWDFDEWMSEYPAIQEFVPGVPISIHLDWDGLLPYPEAPGPMSDFTAVEKTVLFAEDFEGLALGPNVDEALAGDAVWTDTPPEGWVVDESGIPGLGMDETDGVTEWAGWAFADKAWWTEAAGDQDRSLFELGSGTVAVADPDEWDDDERLPIPISADPYDTWLTTPEIKIAGAEAGTLELKFDSSWRPEFDDNLHQTANITASFDGGDPVEVMLWESDEASANYKPYATNETVIVNLDNPEGAKKLVLTFGLFDAGNDWWWAIDNVEVSGVVLSQDPVNPGTDGLVAFYALDGDPNDSSGNGNDGILTNADTGGLGDGGSVWIDDPERGTVISFNGTAESAYVRAGNIPQMTLTNDFTWSFWAKHSEENTADNDIILGNRMDENAVDFVPRQFIKFTPTKFEWHMNGNGDDNMEYDDIPADVWLHHSVVKSGDQLTYYRNGIEGGSGTITQPLDFPQPLFFGGDNEAAEGENWSGLMSDVGIYDRALSDGEVMYLAGLRATPVDPGSSGLLAWWACDEGEGDVVADVSGNGRDGIFVNGDPAWIEGVSGTAVELVGPTLIETPPLDLELTEATMAGWIKPNGAQPDWSSIIMTRDPGLATGFNILGYQLAYHWNDTSTSWSFRGGDMIAEDDWTFAAVTIEPDKATFYVNGEAGSVNEITHEPCLWNSNVYLGGDGTAGWVSRRMNGALDEVVIYDRALSVGEIRYLAGFRDETNLLANGGFEDGVVEPWGTYGDVTTEVVSELVDAAIPEAPIEGSSCLHITVPAAGANFWDAGLQHAGHVFEAGKQYTLSAYLKSKSGTLDINFKPELGEDPWTGYGSQAFTMTEEWTEFSVITPVFEADVSPATITFHIAYAAGDFWVDGVKFYEVE